VWALAAPAWAGELVISDGDTIRIDGERFRLWGIDAPELGQRCEWRGQPFDCGRAAKDELRKLIGTRPVSCTPIGKPDKYGRTVARCEAGGDLGAAMVASGWALDYRKYSGGAYAREEAEARRNGRGLWDGAFTPPWEWRKAH
jgi:endonuclease YncB( thermonuclease family)